jgi:ribosome biogenesis GTPase
MIKLPQGGLSIDNPGMRELQLWDDGVDLDGTFSDISDLANGCRFRDCSHRQEPGCAVQAALVDGRLSPGRFKSHGKMHRELAYLEAQQDPQVERARKDELKRLFRQVNKVVRNRKKR